MKGNQKLNETKQNEVVLLDGQDGGVEWITDKKTSPERREKQVEPLLQEPRLALLLRHAQHRLRWHLLPRRHRRRKGRGLLHEQISGEAGKIIKDFPGLMASADSPVFSAITSCWPWRTC